jgi:hypothetical protein
LIYTTCENQRREVYWSRAATIGGEEWLPQAAADASLKRYKIKRFQTNTGEDICYLQVFYYWHKKIALIAFWRLRKIKTGN